MNLVTVSKANGNVPVTIFQLQDRVNMGNTAELEKAAKEVYTAGGRNLVLDLSKVPSLTSAGIRSLLVIHKLLTAPKDKARHLKLVNPTPHVHEVLAIAGILEFMDVYDSLDEAVASFLI